MGISLCFTSISIEGNNICGFLFHSLDGKTLPKWDFFSVVVSQCYMLCLYVYGLQAIWSTE